ncbi:hypothetical protein CLV59_106208 [Chitinophaga dinghuensis]|uniref:Uncharacterized protein n=1 Tax=Chitinophaga dinghuensis TaxID=1539050 RepID=A0A327VSY2_9BACT|nr:hypothetical protein CLV59_106208 [Chitinophaga dinghuensis]
MWTISQQAYISFDFWIVNNRACFWSQFVFNGHSKWFAEKIEFEHSTGFALQPASPAEETVTGDEIMCLSLQDLSPCIFVLIRRKGKKRSDAKLLEAL